MWFKFHLTVYQFLVHGPKANNIKDNSDTWLCNLVKIFGDFHHNFETAQFLDFLHNDSIKVPFVNIKQNLGFTIFN